jgi:cytochrome c-type biogenesis protein CcmH/NrfG
LWKFVAAAVQSLDKAAALSEKREITNQLYLAMARFQCGEQEAARAEWQTASRLVMLADPLRLALLRSLRDEAANLMEGKH